MSGMKIKYTKTEQARQKKVLKVSLRMLPLFEAMEKSLMAAINSIGENILRIRETIDRNQKQAEVWIAVLNDSWVNLENFISVNEIITKQVDVAGVRVKQFERVDFNVNPIDDNAPLWINDAIELIQEQLQLLSEIKCLEKQIEILEEELMEVRARVKLFENRRIPNAKAAIKKIGQKLQDDERLTIATAKVVKIKKIEEVLS